MFMSIFYKFLLVVYVPVSTVFSPMFVPMLRVSLCVLVFMSVNVVMFVLVLVCMFVGVPDIPVRVFVYMYMLVAV